MVLISLALLGAACGSAHVAQRGPAPSAGPHGPPPAWIETKAGTWWLGHSSFCWRDRGGKVGVCADSVAPECNRQGVPDIEVENGESVRAHLGYTPVEASVEGAEAKLDGRVVMWRIERAGPFSLFTTGTGKDASYVGCAVLG